MTPVHVTVIAPDRLTPIQTKMHDVVKDSTFAEVLDTMVDMLLAFRFAKGATIDTTNLDNLIGTVCLLLCEEQNDQPEKSL